MLRLLHFNPVLLSGASEAKGPRAWPLATLKDKTATFATPEAVFPKRVVYRLVEAGTLQVRLEAMSRASPG